MSEQAWKHTYDSHVDFYTDVYGHALRELRPAGQTGASMLTAEQTAGDWSDAATPDLVIAKITRGRLRTTTDIGAGRQIGRHGPGEFAVIAPGISTLFLCDDAHDLCMLATPYHSLRALGGDALPRDGDFGRLHVGLQRNDEVSRLLECLWSEVTAGNPRGALWADGALLQLAAVLLCSRDGAPPAGARGGLAAWRERRATEYLADNLTDDVPLDALAGVAGLSTFHFARQFKASTGLPPHAYLRRLRCEKAKALLTETDQPVIEIAAQVGYQTPQAFARMFRAEVGISPSEYRRQRRF